MSSRKLVFLRLGAACRSTHALQCVTLGAVPVPGDGVSGLVVKTALDELVFAHFVSQQTSPFFVQEDGSELFPSPSMGNAARPPLLLTPCCPHAAAALLVCRVCWQGRGSLVFMAMTQRMAKGNCRSVVHSYLTPEKVSCVRRGDGDAFTVTVRNFFGIILKEAFHSKYRLISIQTQVCLAMPSVDMSFTADNVTSFCNLRLPARGRLMVNMARAARRRNAKPVREVVEARVASFEAMPQKKSSPSVQAMAHKTIAVHSNVRTWRRSLVLLAACLLALCLIWEASSSQGRVKWLASHLRRSWYLVATTVSTCCQVSESTLRRLGRGLFFLARGSWRCWTRLLQSDRLLIALALACCSLLHLALSAAMLGVLSVRHALRCLEHNLPACPNLVLTVAMLLWRVLVTATITLVFAAVAKHTC